MTDPTANGATSPTPAAPPNAPAETPSGYRGLKVWQRTVDIAVGVYQLARALPKAEQDGLGAELRRTATQVPGYIAAGNAFYQRVEHVQYLSAAQGALARLESTLFVVERLGHGEKEVATLLAAVNDVGWLLRALTRAVQAAPPPTAGSSKPARATRRAPVVAAAEAD